MSSEKENRVLSSELEQIVRHYLASSNVKKSPELEIRFGSNKNLAKPISSVDYKHVVDVLLQNDWKTSKIEGDQLLRITSLKESSRTRPDAKNMDGGYGRERLEFHSVRAEIEGNQLTSG